MKNFSKYAGLLATLALLMLSGCIKMNVNQTIQADGSSHIEVVYDASEFVSYMGDLAAEEGDAFDPGEEGMQEACDDFYTEATWDNPSCTVEEWVFTFSGDLMIGSPALEISGNTYTYDLKSLYETLNAVGESQEQDFSDESLQEQKDMVELTGIEFTYTLTMPGQIVSTDVGEIQESGDTVVINLFDMAGLEQAYVVAEGTGLVDVMTLIIGVVVAVILIGGIGFAVTRKKK